MEKHFIGNYKLGVWDCWTLLQDIYLEEHNIKLPDYPVFTQSKTEFKDFVFNNLLIEEVEEPQKGLFVCYSKKGTVHTGYILNKKEYIHRLEEGTMIDKIRKGLKMYKVKGVRYE